MASKKTDLALIKALRKEFHADNQILKQEIAYYKKHLDKIWDHVAETNARLQDLEIQVNLISRLIATLAVEKMNIRTFSLVKMIRKIEKQIVADDQIRHLENLYRLDQTKNRKGKNGS